MCEIALCICEYFFDIHNPFQILNLGFHAATLGSRRYSRGNAVLHSSHMVLFLTLSTFSSLKVNLATALLLVTSMRIQPCPFHMHRSQRPFSSLVLKYLTFYCMPGWCLCCFKWDLNRYIVCAFLTTICLILHWFY